MDTHSHLDELPELERELQEARECGVVAVVGVGMERESNGKILQLAREHRNFVLPAIGLHPWSLPREPERELEFLREHVEGVVALGEVGMDLKIPKPPELQRAVLREVVKIAEEWEKPLLLHARWAWKEVLEEVRGKDLPPSVFHWYSGPEELVAEILDQGHYLSVTPALEYSPPHRSALKVCPVERILLETDSPVKYGGKEARPKDVVRSLKALSELKGMDGEEVARLTTENAERVFGVRFT
ncbi:MAG: TatD family hydrolase [Candidatus Hadarchaeales archaeon]